jgi:hypothetical protein
MSGLCKYKNIFGKPREGIHKLRIPFPGTDGEGIAAVDVIATFALAYVLEKSFPRFNLTFVEWSILSFGAGFVAHKMFCVDTTLMDFIEL